MGGAAGLTKIFVETDDEAPTCFSQFLIETHKPNFVLNQKADGSTDVKRIGLLIFCYLVIFPSEKYLYLISGFINPSNSKGNL